MNDEDKMVYNAMLADGIITEGIPSELPPESRINPKEELEGAAKSYPTREDGRIDWEQLINSKYLVYPDNDPSKVPMVKVDGLKDVAEKRGILAKEVSYTAISEHMVICKVKMLFVPNADDPNGRMWEAVADATPGNVNGKLFARFLTACAETRAVGRCIKEALGIRMLCQEEITDQTFNNSGDEPVSHEVVAAIKKQLEFKGGTTETLLADIQRKYPHIKSLSDLTAEQGSKQLNALNSKQNIK